MGKKRKAQYIHLLQLPIERVLPAIDPEGKDFDFDGHRVNIHSLRLQTFKENSTDCVTCGIKGSYFWVDRFNAKCKVDRSHLNLYAVNDAGEEILMTHDHILSRSRGGADSIENTQTMCCVCNFLKAKVAVLIENAQQAILRHETNYTRLSEEQRQGEPGLFLTGHIAELRAEIQKLQKSSPEAHAELQSI